MVYVRPGATLASFELLDKESGGVDASTISPELAAAALARMNSGKGASPPRWRRTAAPAFAPALLRPRARPALSLTNKYDTPTTHTQKHASPFHSYALFFK